MEIQSHTKASFASFLSRLFVAPKKSHKGQNGKVLIIGGSPLFHASPLWSAEVASHFVDMVHYSSTQENNEIFLSLKKVFRNGMVVHQNDLDSYIKEDDAILIGPGMMRSDVSPTTHPRKKLSEILSLQDHGLMTQELTHHIISRYPDKRYVIDAGALQMLDPAWLPDLQVPAILTPHQGEFERVFGINLDGLPVSEIEKLVCEKAKKYRCVILLKNIDDFISDGTSVIRVTGGNQGLTKGGTGDVLAGMAVSLYAKNDPLVSAVMASVLVKRAAETLSHQSGQWYNTSELSQALPRVMKELVYNR